MLSEVWECHFTNIITTHIKDRALNIVGQAVNNTFVGCKFATASEGNYGLFMDGKTYNGNIWQPEGNMFLGGFIGEADIGTRIERGLAIKFSHVIIDLTNTNAILGTNMSDITYNDCYVYCNNVAVALAGISTTVNSSFIKFDGCNIISVSAPYSVYVNVRQNGIIICDCLVTKKMYFDDGASAVISECMWNEASDSNARIEKHGTGIVKSLSNTFKYDGSDLPAIAVV
jgi:hypothetical protein